MFTEERLDLGYDYGTVATITTKTTIIERGNGTEQRTIDWSQPLLTFAVGQYSTINEQLETFIAFHRARKGALEGFRFKDWSDYLIVNQFLANGDGDVTEFQLYKTYSVNSWVAHRPITKPVENTVQVFVDAVELTEGWEVDTTTGILTFEEAPTGQIRFSCEFDVPVRFATDEIRLRFEACEPSTGNKIYNWENLTLQEVRLPHGTIPDAPIPQDLNHQINLGYDYGTIGGAKFSTRIDGNANGQEVRSSNWSNPKAQWEVGQRTLLIEELEYLIALFRVARGRAVRFSYLDRADGVTYSVRFGEDAIAFRFDAYAWSGIGRTAIFNLAGMPLVGLASSVFIGLTSGTGLAGINPTGSRHRILEFTFDEQNLFGDLQINGNASIVAGNILQLTPAANLQAGSAFWKQALSPARINQDWSVFFVYEIIENSRYDGIAFVITSSGPFALSVGGGIGYFGIKNMVAVEFDTFQNNEFGDPNNNHIAITTDSEDFAPIVLATQSNPGLNLVGQRWVWIDYVNSQLRVFIASSNSKPSLPVLTHDVVLSSLL